MVEIENIPIEKLEPDPANVRGDPKIDPEFVSSVREGVIQPLVVRPLGENFGVVVGLRRYTAAKTAGLNTLPCKIREDLEGRDFETMCLSAKENWHRLDIPDETWVDIVRRTRMEVGGRPDSEKTAREIAEKLGMSRRSVKRYLKIDELPGWVKELMKAPPNRSLPDWVLGLIKKPSNRLDGGEEALEKMCPGTSEEIPSIAKQSDHILTSDEFEDIELSAKAAEKLARSGELTEWAEEEPARALKVALEAAKAGRNQIEKIIEREKGIEEERKTPLRDLIGKRPERITVKLGTPALEALDEWAEKNDIKDRKKALSTAVLRFPAEKSSLELS